MREVQLCWLCGRFGAALGREPPTGSRGPECLPEPPSLSSDGRGGHRGREVPASPAAGWRCAAPRLPTFPPPALRGEPTGRAASAPVRTRRAAFHRRRWKATRRAGAPSRALGGARGDPAARPPRCPGAAAASELAAWGTGLGGTPRTTHWEPPLPGVLFAKTGEVPSCGGLRAAVTCLDPECTGPPGEHQVGGHLFTRV